MSTNKLKWNKASWFDWNLQC